MDKIYDVFISFKNTDNDGNPTLDSKIASNLYKELEQRGISAFFSNIRLFQFGEAAYKQAIEKALDQSKILVAIATNLEYLNSKWVSYERESFHDDILSERKQNAYIIPYIKNIDIKDLPRSLRSYETFLINDNLNVLVDFIINCLNKNAKYNQQKAEKSLTTGKSKSTYDPTKGKENKRLKLQAEKSRKADMPAIESCISKIKKDTIYVLDAGCAYGYVTFDRFQNFSNTFVLGVDISTACLDFANQNNSKENIKYDYFDLESDDFEENIEALMQKYNIPQFDIIFSSLVIHHLKNPNKFLRKIRKYLSPEGFIILRGSDDGSKIAYGDDGLVEKVIQMHLSADGISDRLNGRKLYSQLITSGYKNIHVYLYTKNTSEMYISQKEDLFNESFSYRKNYFQYAVDKDPYNIDKINDLDTMKYALELLENKFLSEAFWYCESDFIAIAQKC